MTTITPEVSYNGKVIARVTALRMEGVNVRVSFSTGYDIVAAPSQLSDDLRTLLAKGIR